MSEFRVRFRGRYDNSLWQQLKTVFESKTEAERECFNMVHSGEHCIAIVIEMQSVVVSRVKRNSHGVSMDYPRSFMDEDYT